MTTRKLSTGTFFPFAFAALALMVLSATSVFSVADSSFRSEQGLNCRTPGLLTFPKRSYTDAKPSKGKFLIAGRDIADPRFRETVILLIRQGPDGTVGLIVNRPTEVKLSRAFPDIKGLQKRSDVLFLGGPVGRNQMSILIRSAGMPEDSLHIFKDIYVSSSMPVLKRMVEQGKPRESFRVYGGYAGWGTGQLERELSRGDWHVMYADAETIFDKDPEKIWPELILRSSAIQVRFQEHQGATAAAVTP